MNVDVAHTVFTFRDFMPDGHPYGLAVYIPGVPNELPGYEYSQCVAAMRQFADEYEGPSG